MKVTFKVDDSTATGYILKGFSYMHPIDFIGIHADKNLAQEVQDFLELIALETVSQAKLKQDEGQGVLNTILVLCTTL